MKTYRHLWEELCSIKNMELAFRKARRHKTLKPDVLAFEKDLQNNLTLLRTGLLFHYYRPQPLTTFILRDPKTRKISKSDFSDRVIHHALCNLIEPIFERSFIYDSYANRKNKGTFKAVTRFEQFSKKVSQNHHQAAFVLKADIKHYFENVNHHVLLAIIKKKIKDPKVIWLIKTILSHYSAERGMPLGNLTSQFFANVYLHELDYFIKHRLKAKYYLRYVDDFVIMHQNKEKLYYYQERINYFLKNLNLELHPNKTKIILISNGIQFLGFRIFPYHKLLKRNNFCRRQQILMCLKEELQHNKVNYDQIYASFEGWLAYAHHAQTYLLRKRMIKFQEEFFPSCIATVEINRLSRS